MHQIKKKNKTKVFILTIKNSIRQKKISKRLKSLKIKYKFFYAINGREKKNYQKLKKIYDEKKSLKWSGIKLTYPEISCAEAHLRIYKYIVKKKISEAVIMEDDCFPSKLFVKWLDMKIDSSQKNLDIIQLYHSFGIVYKKPEVITKEFSLHKACFNIPYATCYQINNKACRYLIKKNKKIFMVADWPITFSSSKINQYAILPQIAFLSKDHANTSFQKNKWKKFEILRAIQKFIPFYNLLTALYFFLHIPYFFGKCKNYTYYRESFLMRKIFYLKNLFTRNYINLN